MTDNEFFRGADEFSVDTVPRRIAHAAPTPQPPENEAAQARAERRRMRKRLLNFLCSTAMVTAMAAVALPMGHTPVRLTEGAQLRLAGTEAESGFFFDGQSLHDTDRSGVVENCGSTLRDSIVLYVHENWRGQLRYTDWRTVEVKAPGFQLGFCTYSSANGMEGALVYENGKCIGMLEVENRYSNRPDYLWNTYRIINENYMCHIRALYGVYDAEAAERFFAACTVAETEKRYDCVLGDTLLVRNLPTEFQLVVTRTGELYHAIYNQPKDEERRHVFTSGTTQGTYTFNSRLYQGAIHSIALNEHYVGTHDAGEYLYVEACVPWDGETLWTGSMLEVSHPSIKEKTTWRRTVNGLSWTIAHWEGEKRVYLFPDSEPQMMFYLSDGGMDEDGNPSELVDFWLNAFRPYTG